MNKEHYLITIKAEERAGLFHLITGTIEKRQGSIISLNAAPTDIHGVVFITIEIYITESYVTSLAFKLENIIEVFSVQVVQQDSAICLRAAYFRIAKAFLDHQNVSILQKYNVVIVNWLPDAFVIAHHGNSHTVRDLYNKLDGPHLLGFSQTGLISEETLNGSDAESRVTKQHLTFLLTKQTVRPAA